MINDTMINDTMINDTMINIKYLYITTGIHLVVECYSMYYLYFYIKQLTNNKTNIKTNIKTNAQYLHFLLNKCVIKYNKLKVDYVDVVNKNNRNAKSVISADVKNVITIPNDMVEDIITLHDVEDIITLHDVEDIINATVDVVEDIIQPQMSEEFIQSQMSEYDNGYSVLKNWSV